MEHLYNKTIDIDYFVGQVDSSGCNVKTWFPREQEVKCRINWTTQNFKLVNGKLTNLVDAKIYLSPIETLNINDRIKFTDTYGNITYYDIISIKDNDQIQQFLTLEIKERQND